MDKIKLLLIGGTGVLSSAVVNEALSKQIDVTIVNRGKKKNVIPDNVHLIKADYRDRELMHSKLAGLHFDTVIDFICYNKKQIAYSIDLLHDVADQYIFISTTCVYDTREPGIKDEESQKVLPDWDYSVNKWECECYLKEQAEKLGFNYSIVRPCVTYDDTRIPYGVMPYYGYHWTFCARILNGKPVLRWGGGTTRWNMMRVEDFAIGVVGIVGNKKAYGEAFNLSGDTPYSWNAVLSVLAKELGKDPVVFDITTKEYQASYPDRKGEIAGRSLDAIVSNNKIKQYVPDYKTTYTLESGLKKTIESYRKNNYQLGIDWKFDAATDRIIKVLCMQKGVSPAKYNLGFVDYLGTATKADRKAYWLEFHKDNPFVRAYCLALRAVDKVKRTISK
jgi:nucleoside-diphosphate-sugar epimerase